MNAQLIKKNIKSGVTVSLVSIPLSVSLAVASGATPLTGIITAIWAGLCAAIFGGSNFNIVGPTGALSGVIATYALINGPASLPILTVIAGGIILIAYLLKLEKYLVLIPSSVIQGFTLGVAFIIGFGQINYALGLQNIPQHQTLFSNVTESFRHISSISLPAVTIFLLFLGILILIRKVAPNIPGVIILAPIGIIIGYLAKVSLLPFTVQTLGSKFGTISFTFFQIPNINFNPILLETAAVVALIAILETMLSARIADGMTGTKHNERKELMGLGLANIVSGLVGGMPATAALARTSFNIKTGATHKTSAIVNVITIAIISIFFISYFTYLPMPVIAAILVFIAIQMVDAKNYIKFWRYERASFFISILVAIVMIFKDPTIGILIGISISMLIFVNKLSHGQFDLKINNFRDGLIDSVAGEEIKELKENADILLYSFKGKLCYINSRAHVNRFLKSLEKYHYIVLRLREVYFMDLDGIEALDEIIDIAEKRGQKVILTSIDTGVLGLLEQSSRGYKKLKEKKLIFQKAQFALEYLGLKPLKI